MASNGRPSPPKKKKKGSLNADAEPFILGQIPKSGKGSRSPARDGKQTVGPTAPDPSIETTAPNEPISFESDFPPLQSPPLVSPSSLATKRLTGLAYELHRPTPSSSPERHGGNTPRHTTFSTENAMSPVEDAGTLEKRAVSKLLPALAFSMCCASSSCTGSVSCTP